jgi:hypothetical protein
MRQGIFLVGDRQVQAWFDGDEIVTSHPVTAKELESIRQMDKALQLCPEVKRTYDVNAQ